MTNKDILTIVKTGFLAATAHGLPAEQFYKFVKFKRAVQKAYEALDRAQRDFMREVEIEPEDFRNPGGIPAARLERFNSLNEALLAEDANIPAVRIPVKYYKPLYDENQKEVAGRTVDIFADPDVEAIILDNLFIAEEGESL